TEVVPTTTLTGSESSGPLQSLAWSTSASFRTRSSARSCLVAENRFVEPLVQTARGRESHPPGEPTRIAYGRMERADTARRTRMWRFRHIAARYVNPVARRVAGKLPGFGVLTYRGRKTGRTYQTPINVFRRGDVYFFFLTYGSDAQWVKNVIAAGSCS